MKVREREGKRKRGTDNREKGWRILKVLFGRREKK